MRKTLVVFTVASFFAACSGSSTKDKTASLPDTTGNYSRLLADTARSIQTTGLSDTLRTTTGETYVKVDPNQPVARTVVPVKHPATHTASTTHHSSTVSNSTSSSSNSGTGTTQSTAVTKTKKKGWSSAAKGTVIGAGAGAITGAVVSKKKGKGAIIGGLIGAGGGYLIGRSKDKKSGRAE